MNKTDSSSKNLIFLVIVAALGYFVDIYDLVLFSIVRIQSLKDIGVVDENELRVQGQYILNMQMAGLLLGGILWGIMGDKLGRIKVLFGSILLYSLANIANGLVTTVDTYAVVRFIAGIGLAGELGAGITLVSESMSKENRGYGTMIVAGVGLLGAVLANFIYVYSGSWQISYFVGGGLGLFLLFLRIGTYESGLFNDVVSKKISKGNVMLILGSRKNLLKYIYCILIGAPLWFVVGILVTLSPEFGREFRSTEPLKAGTGIMYTYIGIAIGDILAGFIAQLTKSRRVTMLIFHLLSIVSVVFYLRSTGITPADFIMLCLFMGFSVGYWATFVTIASEQFGTNIRATVTTTVPNFVRAALIPITLIFNYFVGQYGLINAAYIVMGILAVLGLFSLSQLKESFGKDLNYIEDGLS